MRCGRRAVCRERWRARRGSISARRLIPGRARRSTGVSSAARAMGCCRGGWGGGGGGGGRPAAAPPPPPLLSPGGGHDDQLEFRARHARWGAAGVAAGLLAGSERSGEDFGVGQAAGGELGSES